jgi:hypothetical protein
MSDQVFFQRSEDWMDEGWTSVPNRVLRDEGLSWEARGMFAFLASHSSSFQVSFAALVRACGEKAGRDKTKRIMRELVEAGYVERKQTRDEATGRTGVCAYTLHSRRSAPSTGLPSTGEPPAEQPTTAETPPYKKTTSKKPNLQEDSSGVSDARPRDEFRPDVEKICGLLRDRIVENGSKAPTITKQWRDEARRMIDLDKRDFDEIVRLIDWCQQDSFWQGNILSMVKFRAQFDRLRLHARPQATRTTGRTPQQTRTRTPGVRYCEV